MERGGEERIYTERRRETERETERQRVRNVRKSMQHNSMSNGYITF